MFLQIDPNTVINTATPYSNTVYGIMVLILLTACVTLWRRLVYEQRQNTENLAKTTGILYQLAEYLKNEGAIEKLLSSHDIKVKTKLEEILNLIKEKIK